MVEPLPDQSHPARARRFILGVLAAAGLTGAAGVALAAAAAHKIDSPALATAATMMMIHAAAATSLLAIAAAFQARVWAYISALMLFAVVLFAGTISSHTAGFLAVPGFLAPIGGSLLIASWIAVAVTAAMGVARGR